MSTEAKPGPNYDRHLIDAESAARMEREGEAFKQIPKKNEDIDTTGGMTVDREGLLNNFAIEPEMYVNEPGDLRQEEEADKVQRAQELQEVNQEGGKHRGQGLV
ncbi:hypothetical protein [Gloeothece verrucosa]|uniref:Uncharacterized protein n=1 Tax=Gloeothece verrucosa (strain PCC 7822) TaxID=497965 RepID=E0U6V4_GLOV7|nr:hypothetical protein [Gloeothece verrucosa]ADN15991.1 conserved hypothetical protein [Gloeothece verrucosa PCC 7822]